MKKAFVYTLTFLLIQFTMSYVVQGVWTLTTGKSASEIGTPLLIVSTVAASVAIILVFIYLKWSPVSRNYIRLRPWSVLCWCCVAALGTIIPSTALQELMPELPNVVEQQMDMLMKSRWGYLSLGLLAPLSEELVMRGAVLRSLLEQLKRPWIAICLSALLFALVHMNPAQMPHAFLIGLLLGWLYWRTGSIVPGVAFHWMNNSIAYVIYNFYPDPSLRLTDIFGSQRAVAAAFAFSLLILLPAIYQLNLRLRHIQDSNKFENYIDNPLCEENLA
jgi:hypothetical protein